MALEEYQRKRRFNETPEPSGLEPAPGAGASFVVQKHDATRLHYDFRLEIGGVLVSWAVPKGPSLNPRDKRLAVMTEDHPLDYGGFEGIIPEGNYGAGTVIVWDNGSWELEGKGAAQEQIARGDLKFRLHGKKLRGSFALVHTGKRSGDPRQQKNWLMIKHRDEFVVEDWDPERLPESVLSGRTLAEVESGVPAKETNPGESPGARKAPMPSSVEPNLATLTRKPFSHPEWLFELKWDGMRIIAFVRAGGCVLKARSGRTVTAQFPELQEIARRLSAREAILDGEAVVLDESGRPDFGLMQQRMSVANPPQALLESAPVVYYTFDLLYCDGHDLRNVPLIERKRLLKRVLVPDEQVRISEHVAGEGEQLYELVRERGLEGIIAKQAQSRYCPGRGTNWLKIKVTTEVDAVVGGYTAPRGGRQHFGALLLGLYEDGKLRYIGSAGSGFNDRNIGDLWAKLQALRTDRQAFEKRPATRESQTYVRPELVARVKFTEWTHEKHLRAPVFVGLRTDVDPKECRFDAEPLASAPPEAVPEQPEQPRAAGISPRGAEAKPARKTTRKKAAEQPPHDPAAALCGSDADVLELDVDGKHLRLPNLNKVYFPDPNLTKRDLLCYYARVAEYILPFLKDRPLTLRRRPAGLKGEEFYQKDAERAPEWAKTVVIESEGRDLRHFVGDDTATLLYLTSLGCIDHNPWPSRVGNLECPDYLFVDLDPTDGTEFTTVIEVARVANEVLAEIGMRTFLKTSGSSGIHIFVPLEDCYDFKQAGMFTQLVSRVAGARVPDLVTFERAVKKRPKGRIYMDYSQLAYGKTLASVYSVRPEPQATVSAPIAARELRSTLKPEQFTIRTMPERIKKVGDLWADFFESRQRLEPPLEKLKKLLG